MLHLLELRNLNIIMGKEEAPITTLTQRIERILAFADKYRGKLPEAIQRGQGYIKDKEYLTSAVNRGMEDLDNALNLLGERAKTIETSHYYSPTTQDIFKGVDLRQIVLKRSDGRKMRLTIVFDLNKRQFRFCDHLSQVVDSRIDKSIRHKLEGEETNGHETFFLNTPGQQETLLIRALHAIRSIQRQNPR